MVSQLLAQYWWLFLLLIVAKLIKVIGDTQYMQQGPRGLCIYQTKQAP